MIPGAEISGPPVYMSLYISRLDEPIDARRTLDPNKPFAVDALALNLTE